jgi:hypothetical protein
MERTGWFTDILPFIFGVLFMSLNKSNVEEGKTGHLLGLTVLSEVHETV